MTFERGDKIHFQGKDSELNGYFLCYIEKLSWTDLIGRSHPSVRRCLVQQAGTGMVFVKGEPSEGNRGWVL